MRSFGTSRIAIAIFSLMAGYFFAGCSFVKSREAAEKVVNHHFATIATNGFEAAMGDYSPRFFKVTPRQDWIKELSGVKEKWGPYQSHQVENWQVMKVAGDYGPGSTVNLRLRVTYSHHQAIEQFKIFKGVRESNYRIISHGISPTGSDTVVSN